MMAIPASLRTATLFPEAAMRVIRVAEPLMEVVMFEKVSFYQPQSCQYPVPQSSLRLESIDGSGRRIWISRSTYGIVNDILGASIIVDVDCDAAQGGDLGGQLV